MGWDLLNRNDLLLSGWSNLIWRNVPRALASNSLSVWINWWQECECTIRYPDPREHTILTHNKRRWLTHNSALAHFRWVNAPTHSQFLPYISRPILMRAGCHTRMFVKTMNTERFNKIISHVSISSCGVRDSTGRVGRYYCIASSTWRREREPLQHYIHICTFIWSYLLI